MSRELLELNLKQILENPFLVADFIFEEEKIEQLSKCDSETLKQFISYFESKENFERIVKLFKGGLYENYYDFRHGQGQFKVVIQLIINGLASAPVFSLSRVLVNFFYSDNSIRDGVEIFLIEIEEALNEALKEEEEYIKSVQRNIMRHLDESK